MKLIDLQLHSQKLQSIHFDGDLFFALIINKLWIKVIRNVVTGLSSQIQ
jgi:hypothetical protein